MTTSKLSPEAQAFKRVLEQNWTYARDLVTIDIAAVLFDAAIMEKDREIERLKKELAGWKQHARSRHKCAMDDGEDPDYGF